LRKDDKGDHVRAWTDNAELSAMCATLPSAWTCDVSYILNERAANRRWAATAAQVEAIGHAGIRAFIASRVAKRERGYGDAGKPSDLTGLAKGAKDRYKPQAGCAAVLKFSQAVLVYYTQETYADMSAYAIPCELPADADRAICQRNLNAFCQAIKTHNGFAGSGSTYDASIVDQPGGAFVLLTARASISD
jgi:hypothetical protein